MKKAQVIMASKSEDSVAEALACFNDLCENSESVYIALLLKAGKKDDFKKKIKDPDKVLKAAIESAECFAKRAKSIVKKEKKDKKDD